MAEPSRESGEQHGHEYYSRHRGQGPAGPLNPAAPGERTSIRRSRGARCAPMDADARPGRWMGRGLEGDIECTNEIHCVTLCFPAVIDYDAGLRRINSLQSGAPHTRDPPHRDVNPVGPDEHTPRSSELAPTSWRGDGRGPSVRPWPLLAQVCCGNVMRRCEGGLVLLREGEPGVSLFGDAVDDVDVGRPSAGIGNEDT